MPFPYPVVASYGNTFIKKFNDNLSSAVAEVLKYIARATAQTIKEEKQETPNTIPKIIWEVGFNLTEEQRKKVGSLHFIHLFQNLQ